MIQLDGTCATEVVAGELVEGFDFEPRCLVVVIAGRTRCSTPCFGRAHTCRSVVATALNLDRPAPPFQEIQVNFTIATGADPDVKIASTNCHNSHVLLRNYELDKTGQAERDELAQVRPTSACTRT